MRTHSIARIALAIVLVAAAGCSRRERGSSRARGDVELTPQTKVLDKKDVEALRVEVGRIVIPAGHPLAKTIKVGDVLNAGVTSQTPAGMLRFVTKVERGPDGVVATTRAAELTEAIKEGNISGSKRLKFDDITRKEGFAVDTPFGPPRGGRTYGIAGVLPQTARQSPAPTSSPARPASSGTNRVEQQRDGLFLGFDDLVLVDLDDDESTKNDQVVLSGGVTLDVDVDFGLDVEDFEIKGLTMAIEGSVSSNLLLTATLKDKFEEEYEIAGVSFAPITINVGIPLVITPRLALFVGYGGFVTVEVQTSVSAAGRAKIGVTYDGTSWDGISENNFDFQFQPPTLDESDRAEASGYAGPRFHLLLYEGLIDTSVAAEFTARIELLGASPWACLHGGMRVQARIDLAGSRKLDEEIVGVEELLTKHCEGAGTIKPVPPIPTFSRALGICAQAGTPRGEVGERVLGLDDGGFLVGADSSVGYKHKIWLVRLDAAGEVVWQRLYSVVNDSDRFAGMAKLGEAFAVATAQGRIIWLDALGRITRVRQMGNDLKIHGLDSSPGGDGLLVQGSVAGRRALVRVAADGGVRWGRALERVGDFAGAVAVPDGSWNVVTKDGHLLSLSDQDGALRAAKTLTSEDRGTVNAVGAVAGGRDGSLALVAPQGRAGRFGDPRVLIARLDPSLALLSASAMSADAQEQLRYAIGAVSLLDDGGLITAGDVRGTSARSEASNLPRWSLLQRFGADGVVTWSVGYGGKDLYVPTSPAHMTDVVVAADGGVLGVGSTSAHAAARCGTSADTRRFEASHQDLWVLKVPATGQMQPRADSGMDRSNYTVRTQPAPIAVAGAAVDNEAIEVGSRDVDTADVSADSLDAKVASHAP